MTTTLTSIITLIVPTYNEEAFIEECLLSVLTDEQMEVLVVDGRSTDNTRAIVEKLSIRFPGLRLLDNPHRTAASGMNIGLVHASGSFVVRLDAHSIYPPDYVGQLVSALDIHYADVSGGVWTPRPRHDTLLGRGIAASLTNQWVMGRAGFRNGGGQVREVDTVPFGCWRTETLRAVGGYDDKLTRSQDYDLSQRLRSSGARIMLLPDVQIEYQARSGFGENIRYNYWNGYWVGFPMVAHGVRFAIRHLIPGLACALGMILIVASVLFGSPLPLMLSAPYAIVLILAGIGAAQHGPAVALQLPFIAAATHFLYGFGTLHGVWSGMLARLRTGWR